MCRQVGKERKPLDHRDRPKADARRGLRSAERRVHVEQLARLKPATVGLELHERLESERVDGGLLDRRQELPETESCLLKVPGLREQADDLAVAEQPLVPDAVLRERDVGLVDRVVSHVEGIRPVPDHAERVPGRLDTRTADVKAAVIGDESVRLFEELLQLGRESVERLAVIDRAANERDALKLHAMTLPCARRLQVARVGYTTRKEQTRASRAGRLPARGMPGPVSEDGIVSRMASHKAAASMAKWRSPTSLWLDHATVRDADLAWMAPAESLVLWNVRLPDEALACLPNLSGVSLRGGSGEDLRALHGCRSLLWLDVNQIRGLHDLRELRALTSLEFLALYGLPRVQSIPSLGTHEHLRRVHLGSMKGLASLAGVADAPKLETLHFSRMVNVSDDDLSLLSRHAALQQFDWFWEDVPQHVVRPVLERLGHLEKPIPISPEQWPDQRAPRSRWPRAAHP